MANPSLQIGNSNWAIKEDNLLGYSTAGTRFVPQPITMTRESAGTRVNSSGLVETVELLGSNVVTNGDFATDSDWIKDTGWTISGGQAHCDGTDGAQFRTVNSPLTDGKTYYISYQITSYTSGSIDVLGQSFYGISGNSVTTVTGIFVATKPYVRFYSSAFNGSIDNVSVKESTKNNLARVDYDGTASSLLVEPERTNTITYSSDFSEWTIDGNSSITPNAITSPDGTLNATKLIAGLSSGRQAIKLNNASTGDLAVSIFAKKGEYSVIQLTDARSSTAFINFDLEDGLVGSSAVMSGEIVSLGNDWYRCSATYNSTTDILALRMSIAESSTSTRLQNFSGNGSDGLYIWGCQVEVGSYPTSIIPTDGSTVTRVQDQYSKTGISNLIGQTEGTWFVDVDFDTLSGLNMFLSIRPDSNSKIEMYRDGNLIYGDIVSSSSFTFIKTGVTVGRYKIALSYSSGSSAMYINGDLISSNSTSFAFTSTLNDLYVGSRGGTSFIEQAKYNDIKLYKTRLSNSELATLTTI